MPPNPVAFLVQDMEVGKLKQWIKRNREWLAVVCVIIILGIVLTGTYYLGKHEALNAIQPAIYGSL
jgi:predicted negative regulator of RcsB-dependent stress response